MAQDTTPAIIVYQGDGSNSVFDVPFDKGYYGDVKVLFVRRGLAEYIDEPKTFTVSGILYAWQTGTATVYTRIPDPIAGTPVYNAADEELSETVSDVAGQTITVNGITYSRASQHTIAHNMKLTWTGDTLKLGDFICIIRETERGQPFVMPNNQKHIERALDNIERQVQELKDASDATLKIDPSYNIPDSHKMNPRDWLKSIIRCMDFSVRAFRLANGWLDYSADDPNIDDGEKTWVHLLNTENIKTIRERNKIVDGKTVYWTEYQVADGTWRTLADAYSLEVKISEVEQTANEAKTSATNALDTANKNKQDIADLKISKADQTYVDETFQTKADAESQRETLQQQIDSNDTDIADLQSTKADKETVYTREEIDGKDTVLQEQITQNTTDITALKTDKADKTYVDETFETKTDAQDSHEQLQTAIDNQGSALDAKITANATAITSLQNDKADKTYADETFQTKADAESQHQELQNQINQNAGEIAELDATKPSKDVDFETPITPENKGATMKEVRDLGSSSLKFQGYVYPTEPEGVSFTNGDLWLASDTMPVDFPVSADKIKKYEDGSWVEYGQDYTVASFDFWRDLNTSVGYYWFGGTWTPMSTDMSTDYFVLNNISGKWEIKNSVNLLGSPTTTTQAGEDSSTKIATTAFVQGHVSTLNTAITTQNTNLTKLINDGLATKANSADVYDKTAIDTKVSGLQSSIDDNASNIATNTTNIATNTASIEKNAGDIATNTASIKALQTSKADTTYVDTTFETKEDATAQYATFETKTEATTALAKKANLTGGNTFTGAQKFNDYITVKDPPTTDSSTTGVSSSWVNMKISEATRATLPTGAIVPYAGDTVPAGFLKCDGSSLKQASYPALFAVIGHKYDPLSARYVLDNSVSLEGDVEYDASKFVITPTSKDTFATRQGKSYSKTITHYVVVRPHTFKDQDRFWYLMTNANPSNSTKTYKYGLTFAGTGHIFFVYSTNGIAESLNDTSYTCYSNKWYCIKLEILQTDATNYTARISVAECGEQNQYAEKQDVASLEYTLAKEYTNLKIVNSAGTYEKFGATWNDTSAYWFDGDIDLLRSGCCTTNGNFESSFCLPKYEPQFLVDSGSATSNLQVGFYRLYSDNWAVQWGKLSKGPINGNISLPVDMKNADYSAQATPITALGNQGAWADGIVGNALQGTDTRNNGGYNVASIANNGAANTSLWLAQGETSVGVPNAVCIIKY